MDLSLLRLCKVTSSVAALALVPLATPAHGAEEFVCPPDTAERGRPTLRGTELWCELPGEVPGKRHGPSIETDVEGNVIARGHYVDGHRHGTFETWSPDGELLSREEYWYEVPGHAVEDDRGICPPAATLVEYRANELRPEPSYDHMTCFVLDEEGNPRNEGPSLAFDRRDDGRPYLKLSHDYRNGVLDGNVRHWRPDGSLSMEETYVDGAKTGPVRSWYESGELRSHREVVDGALDGASLFYDPDGSVRWQARYTRGKLVTLDGRLDLDGVACPEGAAPVTAENETGTWCEKHSGREPVRHGPFVELDSSGNVRERGHYEHGRKVKSLAAQPTPGETTRQDAGRLVARLTVHFDGSPLHAVSSTEPKFWFSQRPTGDRVAPTTEWNGTVGEVYSLSPGRYRVTVAVDEPGNSWAFPGDLQGSTIFDVKAKGVVDVDIDAERILHLRRPFDSASPVPGREGCDLPSLDRSTTFTWDGLGEGVEYEYRLLRYQCDPFRLVGVVAQDTTADPRATLELPPSEDGEYYAFALKAFRGERLIGHLVVHDERGYGWSLRFRVPTTE